MELSIEKIVKAIVLVLSAYIISLDLFFFIGHFSVSIFDKDASIWTQIFVYALVLLNLVVVSFIFLVAARDNLYRHKKVTMFFLMLLTMITIGHLVMLTFRNTYDVMYALRPLSIKTLILLLIYGFLFFYTFKKPNSY